MRVTSLHSLAFVGETMINERKVQSKKFVSYVRKPEIELSSFTMTHRPSSIECLI